MRTVTAVVLCFLVFASCNRYPPDVRITLRSAGSNKQGLKKVLNHYKGNPEDSLKYKAACWLIGNMKWHTGRKVMVPDELWNIFLLEDSLVRRRLSDPHDTENNRAFNEYKAVEKKRLLKSNIPAAVDEITIHDHNWIAPDLLINNIDEAFRVKGLPWNSHLCFEDFCEYILAYRFSDEAVFDVRSKLSAHFQSMYVHDTTVYDPMEVFLSVGEYLRSFYWDKDDLDMDFPSLGFYNIFYWNVNKYKANCAEHIPIHGQILRSVGIPVVEVYTPKWNDMNLGHSWCGLLRDAGQMELFTPVYVGELHDLDRATKFYARTFEVQWNSPVFLRQDEEPVPPIFASACIKDVSSSLVDTRNTEIDLTNENRSYNLCYFCPFLNGSWEPIGWGMINHENRTAHFKNIPVGQIGWPCIYTENGMVPAGPLVEIEPNGMAADIKPGSRRGMITVYRKFPYKLRMQHFVQRFIGTTTVEAANQPDFSDAVIFPVITDTLQPYLQDIPFSNDRTFRYYRLKSSRFLFIAELEFLSAKVQAGTTEPSPLPVFSEKQQTNRNLYRIEGKIIGEDPDTLAFDHDMLTYTRTRWIGIDCGSPRHVNTIRIAPRNADNGILIGDAYELWYWDEKWVLADTKQAKYNYLQFEDVPLNTLYWLRNTSRGREEHPFFYKNGKQVFTNVPTIESLLRE